MWPSCFQFQFHLSPSPLKKAFEAYGPRNWRRIRSNPPQKYVQSCWLPSKKVFWLFDGGKSDPKSFLFSQKARLSFQVSFCFFPLGSISIFSVPYHFHLLLKFLATVRKLGRKRRENPFKYCKNSRRKQNFEKPPWGSSQKQEFFCLRL